MANLQPFRGGGGGVTADENDVFIQIKYKKFSCEFEALVLVNFSTPLSMIAGF